MENAIPDKQSQYPPSIITVSISLLLCGIVYYIFYFHPVAYVHLIVEDSWGEYGTFMCYLISSFILIWAMIINPELRKPGFVLLALCCFIMAMEEVSWLQRILDVKTPGGLAVINNQDELNFHNIKYIKHTKKIFSFLVIFWALVLPFLQKQNGGIRKAVRKLGIPVLPFHLIPIFVLALFFFIAMPIPKYDEINELLFGIGFAWYAGYLLINSYKNSHLFSIIRKTAPAAIIISGIIFSGFLSLKWPYMHNLRYRFNQFASEIYPSQGLYKQAGQLYNHILKNPELILEPTIYHYAEYLFETGRQKEAQETMGKALKQYEALIQKKPEHPEYHITLAKIYTFRTQNRKALVHLNKAVDLYRTEIETAQSPSYKRQLYLKLGDIYSISKQYHKAATSYRTAFNIARSHKERQRTIEHIQNLIPLYFKNNHTVQKI